MESLSSRFQKEIMPKLQKELGLRNLLAVPRLKKIVINIGLKEALADKKILETTAQQLALITGQRPVVTRARKSIAAFKLRAGQAIGLKVTLRGKRRDDFFAKLVHIVLPRTRDFQGVSSKSFDGKGNYSLAFAEQIVFPEIEPAEINRSFGLQATIVTTALDDKIGFQLLKALGMPFKKRKS